MPSTKVKRGSVLRKRRSQVVRIVEGFTTKPDASSPSDGIRRVRLVDAYGNTSYPETRVRVDQLSKTYTIL